MQIQLKPVEGVTQDTFSESGAPEPAVAYEYPKLQIQYGKVFQEAEEEAKDLDLDAVDPEARQFAINALSRFAAELRSSDNPLLTLDCLLYAVGGFASESITLGDLCLWHGVSPKSMHSRVSKLWSRMGLPRSTKSIAHTAWKGGKSPKWKRGQSRFPQAPQRFTGHLLHVAGLTRALREIAQHADAYNATFKAQLAAQLEPVITLTQQITKA